DARRHALHRRSLPEEAHQHVDVEAHARGEAHAVRDRDRRRDGVEAEAAHRVAARAAARLEPDPEAGDQAAIETRLRRARVVDRRAADHRAGRAAAELEEARRVLDAVLAVGVDLQRVAVAEAPGFTQAVHDRDALAGVFSQPDEIDLRERIE